MPKIVDHEARRRELGSALLSVLDRDGIEAVSVRTVAAEAGWTRGVIGHYFADRDDLLLYAYRLALGRESEAAEALESLADPLEQLIQRLMRALPTDPMSSLDFRIFLGLLGRLADRPALAQRLDTNHAEYEQGVLDATRRAIESGAMHTTLPAEDVARMLSVYVDGLGVACALDPERRDAAKLASQLRAFVDAISISPRSR